MKSMAKPNLERSSPSRGEDLGLDGDVERGGGLVGDEQLGRFTMAMAIMTRWRMPPESW
jgi:hypothetical protein